MCGICGVIYKDNNVKVSTQQIKQMSDTLIHRGPDDEGFFVSNNVGLGHRRLSIIDISSGHQPVFNENKTICIVFNGEIYNYQELHAELINKGHKFYTKSDTEAIVHAYEEYGPDCVKKLRGMFAFAIWDSNAKRLMLARDRVGKKPVYYYRDNRLFLFASEIKALFKNSAIKKEVNTDMLDFYLSIGYVPGKETLFKNIYKLEPAQYLLMDANHNIKISEYWDIKDIPQNNMPYEETRAALKEKLLESVKIRLISEVPLGVFLSGGIDSSTIVALMSQLQVKPIKTFSVGYKNEPDASELKYARIVADKYKTQHYEFYLTPEDMFSSINTFLGHSEEPIVESAGIALFKLAQMAKPYATVLLSGEGADELFAGYNIYYKMQQIERARNLLRWIPAGLIQGTLSAFKLPEKRQKYMEWLCLPFEKRYKSVSYDLPADIKERMYAPDFKNSLNGKLDDYFYNLYSRLNGKSMLSKMLYVDTKSWLAEDILTKSDRMTMAASVEMRCPFLDQELIEFAAGIPDKHKLNGSIGKFILKDIAKDMLPEDIVNRKKRGFPVPLSRWFSNALYDDARGLLLEDRTVNRGYFRRDYLEGLFRGIKNNEDLGKRIFSLVTLELWHRKYID